MTAPDAHEGLTDAARETLAEALSWAAMDWQKYAPDGHADHNRWSWRGDGHEGTRHYVYEATDQLAPAVECIVAARVAAERERVLAPTLPLVERALGRVRHDHAYPMEVGPHHCAGCDLEADLRALLATLRGGA